MELVIALVVFVVFVMFFKRSIRRVARHVDSIVTVNIDESQTELVERAQDAYNELIETCGEDFKTPEEIYDLMHHRSRKTHKAA